MLKSCGLCGKEFKARRQKMRFCSRACGVRGRSGICKRSELHKQCKTCGKEFRVAQSDFDKRVHCSMECYTRHQRKSQRGSANHNYRNAGQKICEGCGRSYHSYNKSRRFCGQRCSMLFAGSYALRSAQLGRYAEDKCCQELTDAGYYVWRTRASRGPYDVVAVGPSGTIFIQVKGTDSGDLRGRTKAIEELGRAPVPVVFDGVRSRRKQAWVWVGKKQNWHITEVMPDGSQVQHWV